MSVESFPDQPQNSIKAFIAEVPETLLEYSDDSNKPPVYVRNRKIDDDQVQTLYRFGENTYIANWGNGFARVSVDGKEFVVQEPIFTINSEDEMVAVQCRTAEGERLVLTVYLEDGSIIGTFLPSREREKKPAIEQPEPTMQPSKATGPAGPGQRSTSPTLEDAMQTPPALAKETFTAKKRRVSQELPVVDDVHEKSHGALEKNAPITGNDLYPWQIGETALNLDKLVVPGAKRSPLARAPAIKNAHRAVETPGLKDAIIGEPRRELLDGKVRRAVKKGDRQGYSKGWIELGSAWEIKESPATKESRKYIVPANPTDPQRKRRITVGHLGGHVLAAPENISVTVLGPPGSGKTVEMKRQAIEWLMSDSGFVTFYSTKPELDLVDVAEQFGPVHVFAPFGLGEQNKDIENKLAPYFCQVSPVDACRTWDDAKATAATLVAANQEGVRRSSIDNFFETQAGILFSVALWAAEKTNRPMSDVIRVAKLSGTPEGEGRAELIGWLEELATRSDVDPVEYELACTDFIAFVNKNQRAGNTIASELEVILEPWSRPSVMKATERSTVMPEDLVNKPGTLIIVGTDSNTKHGQIFANLIGRISNATRKQQKIDPETYRHIPAEHGTAIFVDEAQNIGIDNTLIPDVTQGRGYGLVRVSGIQNGQEFGHKYGGAALEVLINSSTVMAKRGIDAHSASIIQEQAGTYQDITNETKSTISVAGTKLESTASKAKAPEVPCFTINDTKGLKDEQAVVMFQAGSLAKVETEPYYKAKHITSVQERVKNAITARELIEKVGIDPDNHELIENAMQRYEHGQSPAKIRRAYRLGSYALLVDDKITDWRAERAHQARLKKVAQYDREREARLAKEREKEQETQTIEVPVVDGEKPASMVIPGDREQPAISYGESLAERQAKQSVFRRRKAMKSQPVRAVGRYLGLGAAPEKKVDEIDMDERER